MAQSVGLRIGIAEGNITKFHIVFIVIPLFHSQRTLVHGIGDIQEGKEAFHVRIVGKEALHICTAIRGGSDQQHDTGYITGDGTDGDSPGKRRPDQDQVDAEPQNVAEDLLRRGQCGGLQIQRGLLFIDGSQFLPVQCQQPLCHVIDPDVLAAAVMLCIAVIFIIEEIGPDTAAVETVSEFLCFPACEDHHCRSQQDTAHKNQFSENGNRFQEEEGHGQGEGHDDSGQV